ncbi:DNA polymerase III subunit alpha [Halobacillus litoralis]|uniref:DNA polymerase III subunit alpha n=1 Tax=Halobacillus litoralis TaxID=45668 RepID=A0A845DT87_9BACI|nr:DNA polymerase III subunit alpha [Halobacillus litoralis]MYL20029.1 DNA polymerase III subunit alpha [Halobacillus litoralis]
MTFTHLNVRSGYSLMKSTVKINDLVSEAKVRGFQSIALTDENTLSGALAFYQECRAHGIQPIIGISTTIEDRSLLHPVLLLAENQTGYKNLMKAATWANTKDEPLSLETFAGMSDGLIVVHKTSASPWAEPIAGRMFEHMEDGLNRWKDAVKKRNFYLSIQDLDLHSERQLHTPLREWTDEKGLQVTAVGDVRYIRKEEADAYHCLRAVEEGTRFTPDHAHGPYYLKSAEEMEAFFGEWWPEVLETTGHIAERCQWDMNLNQQLLPTYPAPEGKSAAVYLRELCEQALHEKYEGKAEAFQRLNHELSVIESMEFSDYFLIVWDFIAFAREKGINAGPGRGSAAGSIVAYLLEITKVDPLEYQLLFERFLNPERITMPDIDIDFPDQRRDEVISYVAEKYGRQHAAQISTFGTFAAKSVLRELFKVLHIDESDASYILHQLPKQTNQSLVEIVRHSEELKDYIRNSEKLKHLFKIAAKLEGLPRHISTHAAGVVLSEQPLMEYTPLMKSQGDVYLTQLTMGDLEKIGLLKIDFLGLRNLTFMENLERKIQRTESRSFSLDHIPLNDPETFSLLSEGKTNGVFQLESQGMKQVLTKLKPTHFEDVVAVNALYRPGPMEYIDTYVKRKNQNEAFNLPHPDLKEILSPTYGVLVYQEQIMQVAGLIAGYSLGQADMLRRAVSKKQGGVLESERKAFVTGALENDYSEQVAEQLFDWIVKFSNYGFNRSHAVAYSLISYQLAFMKAHYPSAFMAELINANLGDREKLAAYIREARDMRVNVKAPSINKSGTTARGSRNEIIMGFLSIKGVGYQAAKAIVEGRGQQPFRHLNDFCLRVDTKIVSRKVIEGLIIAGAFDDLHPNRASALATIDQALEQGELFKEFQDQPGFFDQEMVMDMVDVDPFPLLKNLAMEKEVLGTYLSDHPLESQRKGLRRMGVLALSQLYRMKMNNKVDTAAVVDSIREIRTKRGDPMAFLSLSDETAEVDAVIFPDTYRDVKVWLAEQMLVTASGKVEERNGRKQLIIQSLDPFEMEQDRRGEEQEERRLFIKVTEENENEAIQQLKETAQYFPGNTPVFLFRSEDRKTYRLDESYGLQPTRDCLDQLNDFFGEKHVALRSNRKKTEN